MMFGSKKNKKEEEKKTAPSKTALVPIEKGMVGLTDVIAPSSIEVDFRSIRVGEKFYKTFFVVGYPRFVSPNWLSPVIDFDHELYVSMFIYPATSADVLSDLRRKIAEMEATLSSQVEENQIIDPKVRAALEDAMGLQDELAKGVERFFNLVCISPLLPKHNKKWKRPQKD